MPSREPAVLNSDSEASMLDLEARLRLTVGAVAERLGVTVCAVTPVKSRRGWIALYLGEYSGTSQPACWVDGAAF